MYMYLYDWFDVWFDKGLSRLLVFDEKLKSYSCFHFDRKLTVLGEAVEHLRREGGRED